MSSASDSFATARIASGALFVDDAGIHHRPQRLLAIDWTPHKREGDKLMFILDCGPLGADEQHIWFHVSELDKWGVSC